MTDRAVMDHDIIKEKLKSHTRYLQDRNDATYFDFAATFSSSIISDFDFSDYDLKEVEFKNCEIKNCNFKVGSSNLSRSIFTECEIDQCNFSGRHEQVLFSDNKITGCEMGGFERSLIQDCIIERCKFSDSETTLPARKLDFNRSTIRNCQWTEFESEETDFTACLIDGTTFNKCNLERSNFTKSTIQNSTFKDTDLDSSNFTDAVLESVPLNDVYMAGVIGNGWEIKSFQVGTATNTQRIAYTKTKVYIEHFSISITEFMNLLNQIDSISEKATESLLKKTQIRNMTDPEGNPLNESSREVIKKNVVKILTKISKTNYELSKQIIKGNSATKRPAQ